MDKKLIGGVVAAVLIVSGGTMLLKKSGSDDTTKQPANSNTSETTNSIITLAQLQTKNGKNGERCWVAVNKKVYDVSDNAQWLDGEHLPSRGQAKCGIDGTAALAKSPHGMKALEGITVIAELQ